MSNLGIPTLQTAAVPGVPTAISGLPGLIQQPPTAAVLAAAQNQAAALNYGKLMTGAMPTAVSSSSGGGPQPIPTALSSFRYAPYPIPNASAISASQAVQQAAALAAQQQQHPPQTSSAQQATAATPATQSTPAGQAAQAAQAAAAQLNVLTGGTTSLPAAVSLGALAASSQALQTFAQSGVNAAVIPSVTAGGGLAAPGLTGAPAAAAAQASAGAQAGAPNPRAAAAAAAAAAANPYSGYSLTNVDMSSFQGVDWSSIYGMGMYV